MIVFQRFMTLFILLLRTHIVESCDSLSLIKISLRVVKYNRILIIALRIVALQIATKTRLIIIQGTFNYLNMKVSIEISKTVSVSKANFHKWNHLFLIQEIRQYQKVGSYSYKMHTK